jgi:nuclear cap-binding protein subunit 1
VLVRPVQVGAEEGEEEEDVMSAEGWEGRERWGGNEWSRWETWGWYKQFCRLVSDLTFLI